MYEILLIPQPFSPLLFIALLLYVCYFHCFLYFVCVLRFFILYPITYYLLQLQQIIGINSFTLFHIKYNVC